MLNDLKFKIVGVAPLLMHNSRLSDPLDPFSEKISKLCSTRTKKRTVAQWEELRRLEFMGGFWGNAQGEPVIPAMAIDAMMKEGARKLQKGVAFEAGVFSPEDALIKHPGPKTAEKMYEGGRNTHRASVAVGTSRVMRTRPIIYDWEAMVILKWDDSQVDLAQVKDAVTIAGRQIGVGDWRPKFGRFEVEF